MVLKFLFSFPEGLLTRYKQQPIELYSNIQSVPRSKHCPFDYLKHLIKAV